MAARIPERLIHFVLFASFFLIGQLVLPAVFDIPTHTGLLFAYAGLSLTWAIMLMLRWVSGSRGWPRSVRASLLWALGFLAGGTAFLAGSVPGILIGLAGVVAVIIGWLVDRTAAHKAPREEAHNTTREYPHITA